MNRSTGRRTRTREELEARVRQLQEQVREFQTDRGESRYRELFERSADAILIIDGERTLRESGRTFLETEG